MGLLDIFKKKTYYFDKNISPQCAYCAYGKRTKDGRKVLCEKQALMEETASCAKFIYDPLKRIPTKQLNIEGALTAEEMYLELPEEVIQELGLPEMPDEMKAPDMPDSMPLPEVQNIPDITVIPDNVPDIPVIPDSVPDIPEIPDSVPDIPEIPDSAPDISEILKNVPEVPNFSKENF